MMNNNERWYTSVVVIIIAFICFWPIGLVLLGLRIMKDGRYVGITNLLFYGGIGLILFGLTGVAALISENEYWGAFVVGTCMFILPGAILTYKGYKRKQEFKVFNKYISYINSRRIITIDDMCNKIGVDYETATSVLTDMINKGIIDAYVENDELIMRNVEYSVTDSVNTNKNTEFKKKNVKVIKCTECGAKNSVPVGENVECEYCGTKLQG